MIWHEIFKEKFETKSNELVQNQRTTPEGVRTDGEDQWCEH